MKMLLRALTFLLISLWVGGVLFFPVVAWAAFSTLADAHAAGTVVRLCLHTLHAEGLAAGGLLAVLLLVGGGLRVFGRSVGAPLCVVAVMVGLTAFSQYSIMPRMEQDRLAVGGSVDAAAAGDPRRIDFNRLHATSERVETGVLLAGILLVVLLSRPAVLGDAGMQGVPGASPRASRADVRGATS